MTKKLENQLKNVAILFALALAPDSKSSATIIHESGPVKKIKFVNYFFFNIKL